MWSEADAPMLRLQFESGDDGKVGYILPQSAKEDGTITCLIS
ncbi:MAG: hypothetical protein CM15mP127_15370 [Gammaproteobacteria bacterium]|nr:MAG: hypothetical protein CM15mP127_15370 [Gammaproteobacteria bacterium]